MRICVCISPAPDLEMLTEEDWVTEDTQVDVSFVKQQLNCFDESALETALRLSDTLGTCMLTALTVGGRESEMFMKTLYAVGFDQCVRIEAHGDLRFSPMYKAAVISEYVRQHPQDAVITGLQGSIGGSGLTPLFTAEFLGYPCITAVSSLRTAGENQLEVRSTAEDGETVQTVVLPCVASVGNAEYSYLRVPSLKDRMKYGNKPTAVCSAEELISPFPEEHAVLKSLEVRNRKRATVVIHEGSAKQKARRLYDECLKPRMDGL